MNLSRRSLLSLSFAAGLASLSGAAFAQAPKEIRLDFATYNPVSLVLKEKGLLEKAFEKDGITIRWVQTLGSNKALDRKSTRLNSSHANISYAVFCLKKKKQTSQPD